MIVTVYGRPDNICFKCRATKLWLKRHGIEYKYVNIDNDPVAETYVIETLRAQAVPVVEWVDGNESGVWWDHRIPKLQELAARVAPTEAGTFRG